MKLSPRIAPAAALALLSMLAGPALGQATDASRIRELEKKLERSLELIEQLSAKIGKIEQANAGAREAEGQTAQQAAKLEQIEKHVSQIGSSLSRRPADDGVPLHGFAEVSLARSGENNIANKGRRGMTLGTLDLYLTPKFGDRVKTLIELAFETEGSGDIEADMERLQIGYTFSDAATGWVGRFHTPYGYWNTAYHHGGQIQVSVLRPRFLDFEHEGGILPAHTVGGWLTGSFNGASGRYGYDAYVGNAPRITNHNKTAPTALATSNPNAFSAAANAGRYAGSGALSPLQSGSTSHRTSTGLNVWFEPQGVTGLRVGVHGLRAEVIDDTEAMNAGSLPNRTLLAMTGGYATYHAEPWEVMGEYYHFANRDRSGGTGRHSSWAGYAQAGYNIGRWTPYGRVERANLDQTDNYFGVQENGRSYRRLAAGLRYDVDPKAALKVEFNSTRMEDLGPGVVDKYPELRLQYSVRF